MSHLQPTSAVSRHSIIALTGFMGSGKSSVGRALAARLGWSFVDLDAEIESSQGRKIREIFRREGEAKFRQIEAKLLQAILETTTRPFVLATGGGTFVQSQNAELLRTSGALVIFLEASAKTLLRRCFYQSDGPEEAVRPLAQNSEAFLHLYEERLPFYRSADLSVDSDNRSPDAVAREIALMIASR